MPSAVYMDVHIPMFVTEALRRSGLDVLTSQDDGTATLDDERLLARAVELGRILFSQDQDFLKDRRRVATTGSFLPRHCLRPPATCQPRGLGRRFGAPADMQPTRGTSRPGHLFATPLAWPALRFLVQES